MGVVKNFVIFPLRCLSEVGIRSCRFHAATGRERVSFSCVSQYSPDHTALICKSYTRQIPGVKWTNRSRNHVKFPAFENWRSARLRYLQCVCYWDTDLSWAINLYMTCWIWQNLVHVMACCLRATGHRADCTPLQTTLTLSLRIICGI